ncbi:MAG: CapA family protein [Gemmatimonadales bacterium]
MRPRTGWFSQPYSLSEAAAWLAHNVLGHSSAGRDLTSWIAPGTEANPIWPALTLAFIGDILPLHGVRFSIADEIRSFVRDADVLVGNFEGTLIDGRPPPVFLGQAHDEDVLDLLAELAPPERTVLTCANNHAADYGWDRFTRSCERLEAHGFTVAGRADRPAVTIGGRVVLASATAWSNRPCSWVASLANMGEDVAAGPGFRILCPHWGYELHRYPDRRQILEARRLIAGWDMIVGHHSHCPQPVTLFPAAGGRRVVAYSLGNFVFGLKLRHHRHGLVLKVRIGPRTDGRWAVGRIEWIATEIGFAGAATRA